jgi:hypothetical protein
MARFSLRSLFIAVGLCAVASRLGSEVLEYRAQERGLAGLRALGPAIYGDSRLPVFL